MLSRQISGSSASLILPGHRLLPARAAHQSNHQSGGSRHQPDGREVHRYTAMMPGRRIALLIGANRYRDRVFSQLVAPETDVVALADVLKNPRIGAFDVITMIDQPAHAVKMRIEQLFTSADAMDMLLLYFSGHGVKDAPGRLHLVATDTQSGMLGSTAIGANFLREQIDDSAARKVVIWLDCCYSGAFPPGLTPKSDQRVDVVDQLTDRSGRGCVVMTASTHIQQAFEGRVVRRLETHPSPSVFTRAVIRGLETGEADLNQDGDIDSSELYEYVYSQVKSITPSQTPTRSDQLVGSMLIASNPLVMQLDPAIPIEIRQNLRSKTPGFRKTAVDALMDLAASGDPVAAGALRQLVHYPDAVVSEAAQRALRQLNKQAADASSGAFAQLKNESRRVLSLSPEDKTRKGVTANHKLEPWRRREEPASRMITSLLLVSAGVTFGGSAWLGFYYLWKWHIIAAAALDLLIVLTAVLVAPKVCRIEGFWIKPQLAFVSLFVATSPLVATWIAAA